ncbi:hypothetical protein BVU76_21490 [Mycolicibacterium porcinum]|nr:hypothetical protein BVU76_21490 [Mycolicibacterium porcinum]
MSDDNGFHRRSIITTRVTAVLAAWVGVAAAALALTSCSAGDGGGRAPRSADGAASTQVINEIDVGSDGQPINGYHESTDLVPERAAECGESSPAAVSDNIYACAPSAYGADACWPATGLDLLCMDDPWARGVHRIHVSVPLDAVTKPVTPQPVALNLDDGTHCRLRNGGSWGGRDDGYVGAYRCDAEQAVLVQPDSDPIDQSAPLWTVKVGDLPGFGQPAQQPATHRVVTAWFAAS